MQKNEKYSGIWKHFNGGIYQVHGTAIWCGKEDGNVILYSKLNGKELFARHENDWNEMVPYPDGDVGPRFVKQEKEILVNENVFDQETEDSLWLAGFLSEVDCSKSKKEIEILIDDNYNDNKLKINRTLSLLQFSGQEKRTIKNSIDVLCLIFESTKIKKYVKMARKKYLSSYNKSFLDGRREGRNCTWRLKE